LLMVWSIFCTLVLSIAFTACGGTSSGPVGSTATPQSPAQSYTNDLWAIGDSAQQQNSPKHTLVEHWDGSQWSIVTSPSPGTKENILSAAAVMATNDVWAVGYFNDGQEKTLAEHWDGSRWSVSTTPNPTGFANSILKSVQVVSAKDMWAVGDTSTTAKSPKQTLVEHWDGSQWSIVSSPSPEPGESVLLGVGRLPVA